MPGQNGQTDLDKELDVAKDNLKTFVERYDGSNPVEIPKSPSLATLKPAAPPKKSSSTSSLAKYKGSTTKPPTKQAKTDNNDVGKSSDFSTPARNDNDSIPPVIPIQKPSEVPGKGIAVVKKKKSGASNDKDVPRSKEASSRSSENGVPEASGNITKNLLDQLDQIKITATTNHKPDDKTTNGVNYLQVNNNLPTSTSNGSSALSSRGMS